jgi:hypothetical protein
MANFRSVLAYACSENEGIKPAQSGGQRSQLATDAVARVSFL